MVFLYPTPRGTNNNAGAPVTVRINEWMADNASFMTDPYGEHDDWIELYNFGTNDVDLSGFWLTDTLTTPSNWAFPTGTVMQAGGFLLVWADNASGVHTNGFHTSWALSKNGEAIGLYTPQGWLVDSLVFGAQATDKTEGRWPDGADDRYALAIPTPMAPNIVSTNNSPPILGELPDRELEEGTLVAFQISVTDTDTPPQHLYFELVSGAPSGAVLNSTNGWFSWTPTEGDGPTTNVVILRVSDNGWPVRAVTGQFALVVQEVNAPPEFSPVPDLQIGPGNRLRLLISAEDPDIPANTITYTLLPGGPSNASVESATGWFEWEPDAGALYSTNIIAVQATDNGAPPLSATGRFVVIVGGWDISWGLQADSRMTGEGFILRWTAVSGKTYQVQQTPGLTPPAWSNLDSVLVPTSSIAIKVDTSVSNVPQRFYRILQMLP